MGMGKRGTLGLATNEESAHVRYELRVNLKNCLERL